MGENSSGGGGGGGDGNEPRAVTLVMSFECSATCADKVMGFDAIRDKLSQLKDVFFVLAKGHVSPASVEVSVWYEDPNRIVKTLQTSGQIHDGIVQCFKASLSQRAEVLGFEVQSLIGIDTIRVALTQKR